MLFKQNVLERVARGEVTLAFRRWARPTVKAGGSLRTAVGVLAIDQIEALTADEISTADARKAGYTSVAALRADLESGRPGTLYRIAFHLAGPDPRQALRQKKTVSRADAAALSGRLAGFDAASRDGTWTLATLRLIAEKDGITAGEIAASLGMQKAAFKRKVRKLKELGLTESLTTGYRLSPRGRAFLAGCDSNGKYS
jgi:biotin operon repressor